MMASHDAASLPQPLSEPLPARAQVTGDQPQDLTIHVAALCLIHHRQGQPRNRTRERPRVLRRHRELLAPPTNLTMRGDGQLERWGKVRALSRYLHPSEGPVHTDRAFVVVGLLRGPGRRPPPERHHRAAALR